jgi:hypothetical protein
MAASFILSLVLYLLVLTKISEMAHCPIRLPICPTYPAACPIGVFGQELLLCFPILF